MRVYLVEVAVYYYFSIYKHIMKKFISSVIAFSMPALALAQQLQTGTDASDILTKISSFMRAIIPVLITLGIIYFIWGVLSYVLGKSDEAKKEGRDRMIYGIIGLFVIISIWGLVNVLSSTFGIQQGGTLTPAQIPGV